MVLKIAKKGPNAGGKFWGCPDFPGCKGLLPVKKTDVGAEFKEAGSDSVPSQPVPIAWVEGAPRAEFIPEYVSVGAMPGLFRGQLGEHPILERALTQCVLLSRRSRDRQSATEHAKMVGALLTKILQRGRAPLPTLGLEHEALRRHGLLDSARDLTKDGIEMGWELRSRAAIRIHAESLLAILTERCEFSLDCEFAHESGTEALLQSPEEAWFLNQWVPENLGPKAGHWFTPQASLDKLLQSGGFEEEGARRIDFLFYHPGGRPVGIEIDGPEHEAATAVDKERDEALAGIGINVLRITHDEICLGEGDVLDQIKSICKESFTVLESSDTEQNIAHFLQDCSNASKIQYAIARAIGWGWLTGGQAWSIEIIGNGNSVAAGVLDFLKLLSALDTLYGGTSAPTKCTVTDVNGQSIAWHLSENGEWEESTISHSDGDSLRLVVESHSSPYHKLDCHATTDLIVRPAFLPVEFAADGLLKVNRKSITSPTFEDSRPALTLFLNTVFRKREFRQMQGEAVHNALRRQDCVVLLPTGAGKSLIYQLAGLLMPGVTIVVDPLVSLIEDQVDGLRSYGIDRAAPIARSLSSPEERRRLLLRVERGQYHFVLMSPERLQSPQFRSTLRALVAVSIVNLAVIDEAHCVSEWGHDFRPAYLHLGSNLRRFCTDGNGTPPPLLALTGTASRAVLRDMLIDLEIDRNNSDALIRPESFDRPELRFRMVHTSPAEDPSASLRGVLNGLHDVFGLPQSEFYNPRGRDTASGIIFVPTVNARPYGLFGTRRIAQAATGATVTIYSGSAPKGAGDGWDEEKRSNAKRFKRNEAPVLIATKAFGMGIDKPNIRYTVHFGMPGSLESFYQEAGRAGRDRGVAACIIVYSEFDEERSDALLDPDQNLSDLRDRFKAVNNDRSTGDDITRALWFHLEGFSGVEDEINDIERMLDNIESLDSRKIVSLPFGSDDERKKREKSLYRLLRIGVIADYEVDFGARKFTITSKPFNFEYCKNRLLEYVYSAQPAKAQLLARQLDIIEPDNEIKAAFYLARALVEFTYDVIERSRRRMIQESVLLARMSNSDEEIRARLLAYLQEGLGAERINELLENPTFSLLEWCEVIDKCQTPIDAGELRGLCIRALESYPDHPGLLLTRAVAEAMCSDHDDSVSLQGLGSAMHGSILVYKLEQAEVKRAIDALFDLAHTQKGSGLGVPFVVALLGLDETNGELVFAVDRGLERAGEFNDDRVRVAVADRRMRRAMRCLEGVVSRLSEQYDNSSVLEMIAKGA